MVPEQSTTYQCNNPVSVTATDIGKCALRLDPCSAFDTGKWKQCVPVTAVLCYNIIRTAGGQPNNYHKILLGCPLRCGYPYTQS